MKITTINIIAVILLTSNALVKSEDNTDCLADDIHRSPALPTEPLFDQRDNIGLNNYESIKQLKTNVIQSDGFNNEILNNNDINNVVTRNVEVVNHGGDTVTKYETTSYMNQGTNQEFSDTLFPSVQPSNVPGVYTQTVKKTVIEHNNNGGNNSEESVRSVQNVYCEKKSNKIEIGNSIKDSQTVSEIDYKKNNAMPLTISPQQVANLSDDLKNIIQTTITETTTHENISNDLNGPVKGIAHESDSIKNSILSNNDVISTTSSRNSNYNDLNLGSLQPNLIGENYKTQTISKTSKIIKDNSSNNSPRQDALLNSEGDSFKHVKTTTTSQQNLYGDDYNGVGEQRIGFNSENTRSTDNFVSIINPAEYNQKTTTTTVDENSNNNANVLKENSLMNQNSFSKNTALGNSVSESITTSPVNHDLTNSLSLPSQNVSFLNGLFKQMPTIVTVHQGSVKENDHNKLDDQMIESNVDGEMRAVNNKINSNYVASSDNNGIISSSILPIESSGITMSEDYFPSITTNGNTNDVDNIYLTKMNSNINKNNVEENDQVSETNKVLLLNNNENVNPSKENQGAKIQSSENSYNIDSLTETNSGKPLTEIPLISSPNENLFRPHGPPPNSFFNLMKPLLPPNPHYFPHFSRVPHFRSPGLPMSSFDSFQSNGPPPDLYPQHFNQHLPPSPPSFHGYKNGLTLMNSRKIFPLPHPKCMNMQCRREKQFSDNTGMSQMQQDSENAGSFGFKRFNGMHLPPYSKYFNEQFKRRKQTYGLDGLSQIQQDNKNSSSFGFQQMMDSRGMPPPPHPQFINMHCRRRKDRRGQNGLSKTQQNKENGGFEFRQMMNSRRIPPPSYHKFMNMNCRQEKQINGHDGLTQMQQEGENTGNFNFQKMMNSMGMSPPPPPEFMIINYRPRKQIHDYNELSQMQQYGKNAGSFEFEQMGTQNLESMATQNDVISDTTDGKNIKYTKTIKTIKNIDDNSPPVVHIIQTQSVTPAVDDCGI